MRGLTTVTAGLLAASGAHANLNQLAQAAGKKYFGSATDNGELTDSAYTAILKDRDEFGQITPGNGQKWQYTEPTQGDFSYTSGDEIADLAASNGQILRCHTLVWHSQLPSWVSGGSFTADAMTDVIQTHIANVVGHYKGQCYAWDVVNEALNEDGSFRSDVFYDALGTDFLPLAFAAAAAADPDARLYYNDYNIESAGAKHTAALGIVDLVAAAAAAGARIDGVGLQAHFIVGSTPAEADLVAALRAFAARGVEVAYTELDVRFGSLPPTADGLARQADDYAAVARACLAVDACVGLTVWDFTDKYSWVPATFDGQGAACLFDEDLAPKPAYSAVSSVLAAAVAAAAAAATDAATTATAGASTTLAAVVRAATEAVASRVPER